MNSLFPVEQHIHLQLTRVGQQNPRRKRPGGPGKRPDRVSPEHGEQLSVSVEGILAARSRSRQLAGINPNLVLRVHLSPGSYVDASEWQRSGFTVLGNQTDNVVLLFADDIELGKFRQRIARYSLGSTDVQKQQYSWIAAIDRVTEWGPEDRRGRTLSEEAVLTKAELTLDVELWYPGSRQLSQDLISRLREAAQEQGASVLGSYSVPRFLDRAVC